MTGLHPFGCEVGSYSVHSSRFQPPPHQTQHADFPHYAFLITSHRGLCGPSGWERFPAWNVVPNAVVVEQPQLTVHPLRTPPLPAETASLSRAHQVPPDLLLHPASDTTEARAGVPDAEVIDPASQYQIDPFDQHTDWLGPVAPENILQFSK